MVTIFLCIASFFIGMATALHPASRPNFTDDFHALRMAGACWILVSFSAALAFVFAMWGPK